MKDGSPWQVEYIGLRIGRLVVIDQLFYYDVEAQDKRHLPTHFLRCVCDCGGEVEFPANKLSNGRKSCGCLHAEAVVIAGNNVGAITKKAHVDVADSSPSLYAVRHVHRRYEHNARNSDRSFAITIEDFQRLCELPCTYCGVFPHRLKEMRSGSKWVYNGLDRVDATRGYEMDNVVPCCWRCNEAKKHHTQKEFLTMVREIAEHQGWTA